MASPIATNVVKANIKVDSFVSTSGNNVAKNLNWVDMKNFNRMLITAMTAAGSAAGLTSFKIVACTTSDGLGTVVEIKNHSLAPPLTVSRPGTLECSAEEIKQLGSNLRYVSAQIISTAATDTVVATYVQTEPRFAHNGLTSV